MDVDEEGEPIYDPEEEAGEEEWQQPPVEDEVWQHEQEEEEPAARSPQGSDAEEEGSKSNKPRKRLVKKSAVALEKSSGRRVEDERQSKEDRRRALEKASRAVKQDRAKHGGKDKEMNEMWNSVAGPGGDSEDDNEGLRNNDDEAFIDDTGVEAAAHYIGSDDERASAGDAPQAEEGEEEEDELKKIFKSNKKRKPAGQTDEEIIAFVEIYMNKMAGAAEADADLNRRSKPAINKLKLLPTLVNVLQKRQYQNEFLDRGVLSLLKNWLEPLPDGSLPNMNIRTAILQLLTDLPIDLEHEDRRDQLKRSGLGKVVMFLSRLDEETSANKKLAKDLVDKWSRPLFQKSTRYESLRTHDEERPLPRKPPVKKRVMNNSLDEDLMEDENEEAKPGQPGYRNHASRPEAIAMDFVVRPQSKVDMEEIQNARKQQKTETKRSKMNKKLQQLRTPKKRKLQAERISVEGRGLVRTV